MAYVQPEHMPPEQHNAAKAPGEQKGISRSGIQVSGSQQEPRKTIQAIGPYYFFGIFLQREILYFLF
jgi:hypothetical protein